jgi:hypothetical protein
MAVLTGDAPATGAVTRDVRLNAVTVCNTVTEQVAVLPPSVVVTVIVALPPATAVTTPLAFTVATAVLLDAQLTAWFVASAGLTVAVRVGDPPTVSSRLVWFRLTPVTAMSSGSGIAMVTAQTAVLPPSAVFTVILAVPAATAVMTPLEFTVAIAVLLDVHDTFLFVAFAGLIAAVRVAVPPGARLRPAVFRSTPVTAIVAGVLGGVYPPPPPPPPPAPPPQPARTIKASKTAAVAAMPKPFLFIHNSFEAFPSPLY